MQSCKMHKNRSIKVAIMRLSKLQFAEASNFDSPIPGLLTPMNIQSLEYLLSAVKEILGVIGFITVFAFSNFLITRSLKRENTLKDS